MTAVIWIDWYSYHISRFRALAEHESFRGKVTGIELVGGCGVHPGLKFRADDREGLPIVSLLPTTDWKKAGRVELARAVWRKLTDLSPSAVLVPGIYTVPGFVAAFWAKVNRKRSILMSETTEGDYRRLWWKELGKRALIKTLFSHGIAGGRPHIRYLCKLGLASHRIGNCYDVVDNNFFDLTTEEARRKPELKKALGVPDDYFLYVGRLSPEKNLAKLIDAFVEYRQQGGLWSLVLVGDGPLRRELEDQCRLRGVIGLVHFAGMKTTLQLASFYAFARCFILPSTREPWGLVVNEAMASHLPVIVSKHCGCAEDLVEAGGNGYLFDPDNSDDMSGRMLAMSASSWTTRGLMGQRSWQIIQGYSLHNWAEQVARIVSI